MTPSVTLAPQTPALREGEIPDLTRGIDCGPWDSSEVAANDLTGRHRLEGRLYLDRITLPIPHRCRPVRERTIQVDPGTGQSIGGETMAVHIDLASPTWPYRATGATMMVSVLAAGTHDNLWVDTLCDDMADRLRDTPGFDTITTSRGPFGPEIVATAARQQSLTIGIDGPRWCVVATLYAPALTHDMLRQADSILADTVVYRGADPKCPAEPMGLRFIQPRPVEWTPRFTCVKGD